MSYVGNTPTQQAFTPAVDFFNGDGSTVAFTLSKPVASVAQVQAVISNVPQNPGSAYTVSGNTITFTSAPPAGSSNIYVYYTSPITQVIAPGQNTVSPTALSTGAPTWDTSGNVTVTGKSTSAGVVSTAAANISGGGWGVLPYVANSTVVDNNAGQTRIFATGANSSTYGTLLLYAGTTNGTATLLGTVGKDLTFALQGATQSAGTGIAFPATQLASSDANTLDDYEEGTWTPNVGGNATYSAQTGSYTKVGRLVTVTLDFTISTIGTGNLYQIVNLPFTASSAPHSCGSIGYYAGAAQSFTWMSLYVNPNDTRITFVGNNAASNVVQQNAGPAAMLQNGTRIICSVTYLTT